MNTDQHPIYRINAFQIYTKPIEYIVNKIMFYLDQDYHGCYFHGGGRLGKTSAISFLEKNQSLWLGDIGIAARIVMPGSNRNSYNRFFEDFGEALDLIEPQRAKDKGKVKRIGNNLLTMCGQNNVQKIIIFIDNAQTISRKELDFLVELDDYLEKFQTRLFLVQMYQNDYFGIKVESEIKLLPIHITGRHFMGGAEFKPLTGLFEIQHALSRYDYGVTWPDNKTSFTQYFAAYAWDQGWTLSSQATLIYETMLQIRKESKIDTHNKEEFPMMSFTSMVKYLLCDIAGKDRTFTGFDEADIRKAINASGFVKLEIMRCKLYQQSTPL